MVIIVGGLLMGVAFLTKATSPKWEHLRCGPGSYYLTYHSLYMLDMPMFT